MDIPTIPGAVYTISSATSCDVTDKASGQLLGTASSGSPFTTPAYSDALTLSDPAALYVQIKNFNYALAALGLLGEGSTSALPAGYLAAEFLECNHGKYIWTNLLMKNDRGFEVVYKYPPDAPLSHPVYACKSGGGLYSRLPCPTYNYGTWWDKQYSVYSITNRKVRGTVNFKNDRKITNGEYSANINYSPTSEEESIDVNVRIAQLFFGLLYSFRFSEGDAIVSDMIPALDFQGAACMFDRVTKKAYLFTASNGNNSQPVIGLNLSQALKLATLPATGGTLTISIPTGYDTDSAVMSALENARANGWTLTIQTYTPDAESSATTFSLRRIWVRRTQNENGLYIAAGGTRWQVDWCVTMYTPDDSTPDQHGYELFRSVEAACDYWGLSPYVAPTWTEEI